MVEAGAEERETVSDGETAKLDASRMIQVLGGRKIVNLSLVNPTVVWAASESPPIPRMMGAAAKNKKRSIVPRAHSRREVKVWLILLCP